MMTFLKIFSHGLGCNTWRFAPLMLLLHGARVLLLNEAFLYSVTFTFMKIQMVYCTGRIIAFFSLEIHAAAAK